MTEGLSALRIAGLERASMELGTSTTRVAVTGIAGGGKTVFLTSLLWHLAESPGSDFHSANGVGISGWREVPLKGSARETFPLDSHRESLARRCEWPEKTTDSSRFVCEYKRPDWRFLRQRLQFIDFPGERVADAAIAAYPNYNEWSDRILHHWSTQADYREAAQPFLDACARPEATEEELLGEYRRTLARLIIGYKPLVSPSVFLLDRNGGSAPQGTVEALASSRRAGLEGEEFCPLPASARDRFPDMAGRFRNYRRQVVKPIFKELTRCHVLVALVDIPALLMGGVGRYNDERQIMLDLVDCLRPETTIGGKLLGLLQGRRMALRRAAFVAGKCDLVHPNDIENDHLESLLREMNARAKGALTNVDVRWFCCSACLSTRPGNKPGTLIARLPIPDSPDGREEEFPVTALPDEWPADWQPGVYRYQQVLPSTARNLQKPPAHARLDRVFEFIAG